MSLKVFAANSNSDLIRQPLEPLKYLQCTSSSCKSSNGACTSVSN